MIEDDLVRPYLSRVWKNIGGQTQDSNLIGKCGIEATERRREGCE